MTEILLIYERNKVAMHKTFSDLGGTAYSATCSSYPEYLESEKADIPNYYKEHIQVFEDYWRKQNMTSSSMAAFNIAVLQVLTCGLGFGIGYLFKVIRAKRNQKSTARRV